MVRTQPSKLSRWVSEQVCTVTVAHEFCTQTNGAERKRDTECVLRTQHAHTVYNEIILTTQTTQNNVQALKQIQRLCFSSLCIGNRQLTSSIYIHETCFRSAAKRNVLRWKPEPNWIKTEWKCICVNCMPARINVRIENLSLLIYHLFSLSLLSVEKGANSVHCCTA